MKKSFVLNVISIENLKPLKLHMFLRKHQFFLLLAVSEAMKVKKTFKTEKSIAILKFLALTNNVELCLQNM